MPDFAIMRRNMVKGQVLPEEVTNPVLLDALSKIPREWFVPHQLARIAYMDVNFPLSKGRVLLRSTCLARLLAAASFSTASKVLYIAGGTGYGPALLGHMGIQVIALDSEESFTQISERLLHDLKLSSVEVILGSLTKGWEKAAPYDTIIIEGSVEYIPASLNAQLKEGGEIITLRHRTNQGNDAVKYVKKEGELKVTSLFDAFAPRLEAFRQCKTFVF